MMAGYPLVWVGRDVPGYVGCLQQVGMEQIVQTGRCGSSRWILGTVSLTANFHNTLYTLMYGIITYHYNTIVQISLVLKKVEFNMEKKVREALKIGLKKNTKRMVKE